MSPESIWWMLGMTLKKWMDFFFYFFKVAPQIVATYRRPKFGKISMRMKKKYDCM